MKARRKIEKTSSDLGPFEFRHRRPENTLVVENHPGRVTICAARDNFSARQRRLFVDYLVAEGFIPGSYRLRTMPSSTGSSSGEIQWLVLSPADDHQSRTAIAARRTTRFMLGLFAFVCGIWLLQLAILYLTRP